MTGFASQYPRDENDWILFPTRDVSRRKDLFPQEVFAHPAKANIFLIEELVEYLTKPGDVLLDPFGGTGTLMIAALHNRHVTTIELEDTYLKLMQRTYAEWIDTPDLAEDIGRVNHLQGDCRLVLPVPCDHIIFSPPYSTALGRSTGLDKRVEGGQEAFREWATYSAHSLNLGRLNPFLYEQAMMKVYTGLAASVPTGGTMSVIIKDTTRGEERVFLSRGCIKGATKAGFKLTEWHKWKTGGSAQAKIMRAKGAHVIADEDILIFRRN
ncbi:hypothetical protein LCGC14_2835410 [marine sediment metagenome]|uniref:DNA methylase N-4/N-6 domain-containing protein n=1 Tax=marine sediment metagenome TaxID=412755 RepID=A0A0F8YCY6_9ZZZZ